MNTRNGKIARLPKTIREELNRRLEDGWTGPNLLEWLNSLPQVQSVLQDDFNGHPISESNLTHWRSGGYLDWLKHQDDQDQIRLMIEDSCDLEKEEIDGLLCDRIARIATIELARQTHELNAIEDPGERWKKFQELSREISRLQNGAHYARHVQIRCERWQWEQRRRELDLAEKRADQQNLLTFLQSLPAHPPKTPVKIKKLK